MQFCEGTFFGTFLQLRLPGTLLHTGRPTFRGIFSQCSCGTFLQGSFDQWKVHNYTHTID